MIRSVRLVLDGIWPFPRREEVDDPFMGRLRVGHKLRLDRPDGHYLLRIVEKRGGELRARAYERNRGGIEERRIECPGCGEYFWTSERDRRHCEGCSSSRPVRPNPHPTVPVSDRTYHGGYYE